jgi:hypothetical protein
VQAALRQSFAIWGLPQRLRVDNGTPWGATGGLPTALALWLIGLGVGVIWNPPRRPQRNGVVERSQGVSQNWGEPGTCATYEELQERLTNFDRIQREQYPYRDGRSRQEVWPALAHSGRPYHASDEEQQWQLQRVLTCLSEHSVPRRVDRNGKVSLYDRCHWVGRRHVGRDVFVTLDPETAEWLIQEDNGPLLKRVKAQELTAAAIRNLAVSRPRPASDSGQTS